jgi:hypothetical protein
MSIEELRNASDRGQFIEAQFLSESLQLAQNDQIWSIVKVYLDELERHAAETAEQYRTASEMLSLRISDQETEIREAISDEFHELQVRHVSDLVAHEKQHLLKYARERLRPVHGVRNLQAQARKAAMGKDFDTAEEFALRAKQRETPELERREGVVRNEFLMGRAEIIERQKGEMRALAARLDSELEAVQREKVIQFAKLWVKIYRGPSEKGEPLSLREKVNGVLGNIKEEVEDVRVRAMAVRACNKWLAEVMELEKAKTEGEGFEIPRDIRVDVVLRNTCPIDPAHSPKRPQRPRASPKRGLSSRESSSRGSPSRGSSSRGSGMRGLQEESP